MKSNAQLQKDIYEELKWDPRIHEGDIGVSVANGIVTLSGCIPTFAEMWAAEEATKKVVGVTAVVNKMEVKLTTALVKGDQELAEAATNAIKWHVFVPSESIKILIDNGWITLSGKVEHKYQKESAYNAVKNLLGVRGVFNEIIVEPKVRSKDIQYQIKCALHRHAEEDANNINIDVADGEVVLSGKVRSWSERNDAEWAALATTGVRKVKNNVLVSA